MDPYLVVHALQPAGQLHSQQLAAALVVVGPQVGRLNLPSHSAVVDVLLPVRMVNGQADAAGHTPLIPP